MEIYAAKKVFFFNEMLSFALGTFPFAPHAFLSLSKRKEKEKNLFHCHSKFSYTVYFHAQTTSLIISYLNFIYSLSVMSLHQFNDSNCLMETFLMEITTESEICKEEWKFKRKKKEK